MYPELSSLSATRSTPSTPGGAPVEAGRLLRALGRRKRMLLAVGIVGAIAGVIASRFVDPTYRSTTMLVWDDAGPQEPTVVDRKLKTAVDAIEMPATLEQVRSQLGISVSLDALAARIEARTTAGSDIVHISALGTTGRAAAELANAVTRAFLNERVAQVRRLARENAEELGRQIEATTKVLSVARRERDLFRERYGVVDLPSERTLAVEKRVLLATDSERARADAGVERARSGDLHVATKNLPAVTVLTENESRPDVRRLAEAENELAMLRGSLTEDSPRRQIKQAEVDELRTRTQRGDLVVRAERIVGRNPIRDFIEQQKADAAARATAAERRHGAYRELADKAKQRIDELNKLEGEAAELDNKVLSLDTRLGALRRDQQAALERAEVGGADLHVTAPGTISPRPFQSRRKLVAAAVPVMFVLLTALGLLVHELRGLRAATPRELSYWSSFPVVASCDRLSDRGELNGVVTDLGALLHGAEGETLLVPATPYEREATEQLATRLETLLVSGRSKKQKGERKLSSCTTPIPGARLRRRIRSAARVLVVAGAGRHRPWTLRQLPAQLGRSVGVGLVVIEVGTELALVVDRVGSTETVITPSRP